MVACTHESCAWPAGLGAIQIAKYALSLIERGHVVLVHCDMGQNRSSFVNALLVMAPLGIDGGDAIRLIRSKVGEVALNNRTAENFILGMRGDRVRGLLGARAEAR